MDTPTILAAVIVADLEDATLVGPTPRVEAKWRDTSDVTHRSGCAAILIAAVPPIVVKTGANPEGLPMKDEVNADLPEISEVGATNSQGCSLNSCAWQIGLFAGLPGVRSSFRIEDPK